MEMEMEMEIATTIEDAEMGEEAALTAVELEGVVGREM